MGLIKYNVLVKYIKRLLFTKFTLGNMKRMQMRQIRVGNSDAIIPHLDLCAQVIAKESVKDFFIVKEKGKRNEKEHIHCFIWTDDKVGTFRKRLKKALPFLDRGNYSIIPPEDDQPVLPQVEEIWKTYACKGEKRGTMPNVLFNTMLTQENIVERHHKYWDLKKEEEVQVTESQNNEIVVPLLPPKRVKKPSIVDQVADYLMDNNPEKKWTMCRDDRRIVFNEVMRRLGRLGKTLDATIVRRMCYGVHNIISHEELCDDIWSQIYPEF